MCPGQIPSTATVTTLLHDVVALRDSVAAEGGTLYAKWRPSLHRRAFQIGALNMAHYLALRRRDLRTLQTALMPYGLSSLGRAESRVLPVLDAVVATLEALNSGKERSPSHPRLTTFFRGERILRHNTDELFGRLDAQSTRHVRIMVTLPSEASEDYALIRDLALRGMNIARINCAHDTAGDWRKMIEHINRASMETGRAVKVHMDLGGPKPRTADVIGKRPLVKGEEILMSKVAPDKKTAKPFAVALRCTLPEVVDQLAVGETVWIDDGKLGTVVARRADDQSVVLRVVNARASGDKVKEEKGLNFPDSDLTLSPLTDEDLGALDFVALHADTIGYSFVQKAADIVRLQKELAARNPAWRKIGLVAKIETPRAIANLPALIVAGAGMQRFGVMIARGDMAIEVGYERTAEMQEEILWLCEAAHVPVIWATQVLDRFVKEGTPSRGEMTDAAMSGRAECVMLNKGPFVTDAVSILDGLLTRMQAHQSKKTPQLRALRAWVDDGTGPGVENPGRL